MSIKSAAQSLNLKYEISEIFSEFSADLEIIEDKIKLIITSDAQKLTEISSYLLNLGGKRIRPLLCLLSARMFGMQRASQALVDVASGIEMIHMATLLHDDIIDKSPTRRGKPTACLVFGSEPTLLAGDFLFVRAFGLCGMLDKYTIRATEEACIAVIEGEELEGFINNSYPVSKYYDVIKKKTSALFALSCKIGAHLTGASPEIVTRLHEFGIAAGNSFQVVDDILDITSDEKTLGKKPGNDLRQGTPTLINLLWLKEDSDEARRFFLSENKDEDSVNHAMESIKKSTILDQARVIANQQAEIAKNILDQLPGAGQKEKDMFNAILNFTLNRLH